MAHEDAGGRAFVAYDDPYYVAGRHGTKADTRTAKHLSGLVETAAGTQRSATEGAADVLCRRAPALADGQPSVR